MKATFIWLVIGILLVFGGYLGIHINNETRISTEEEIRTVWIPENVELRPKSQVVPGTFRINLPFDEFQSQTKPDQKTLVVYGEPVVGNVPWHDAVVEYWRARGDGTFDYTAVTVSRPDQTRFQIWSPPKFDRKIGAYRFVPEKDIWLGFWGFNFLFTGVIIIIITMYVSM